MTLPILLIEGDPARAQALRAALAFDVSDSVIWVDTLADALCELAARSMACILLNLDLSDGAGGPLIDTLMSAYPEVPIVVLSGSADAAADAAAVDAVQRGADPAVKMVGRAVSFAGERVGADVERAQHDMQYRAVVESLGEGLLVLSASGRIQSWNRAAEEILGRTHDEMLGRSGQDPFGNTVDDARRPITPADYPGAIAVRTGRAVHNMMIGFQQPGGDARWVSVSAYPMRNEVDARRYGAVVSIRDVTAYRAALDATLFQAGLLDAVAQAVLATDPAGIITYWNKGAECLYGWTAASALGQDVLDLVPMPDARAVSETILGGLVAGRSWTGVIDAHDRGGRLFPAEVTVTPVLDGDGVVTAIIGVSTDITERRRTEDAMRQLSAIVESSDDAIIGTALDLSIVSWNRGAERLYGRPASAVLGTNALDLRRVDGEQDHREDFGRVARTGQAEHFETIIVRPDGGKSEISLALSPVYGGSGAVTGYSIIGRDVTARNTAERALVHQSLHDDLTGLPNRALLDDRLTRVLTLAPLHHRLVAVYFLDLDEFKLVNDGFGHVAGDSVLVEIASRLREALRPEDTVARFGGDEFVVVCEVGSTSAAAQVGSRLLAAVEAPFALHGEEAIVTCSIGLAIAGADATPTGLLQDCDAAMYRAKARGRSRLELFDETSRASSAGRLQTTTALRRALERNELRVFFQPVVSILDARPIGIEALVRWQHPERGLVPPDDFIPLAESTGLIVPIGSWVLHEALLQRAKWEAALPAHPPLRLAVNLSARQLSDPGLIADVTAALAESGAAPGSLVLEITESVLMEDRDSWATLHALRDLGISLHVDDFGTGYSSLAYLKSLPVDALKVDRSFVDGLGTTPEDLSIVTAVMSLAGTLSLAVVAEGVETELQLDVLRGLGCDYAQGFLFARPLPYDELVGWLARTAAPARRV